MQLEYIDKKIGIDKIVSKKTPYVNDQRIKTSGNGKLKMLKSKLSLIFSKIRSIKDGKIQI